MGRTLLVLQGVEHQATRALVSPSFRTALLERWRDTLVELVVDELIDRFADRGRVRGAIEEALRWEPPIAAVVRVVAPDTELGGIASPAADQ